jgi:sialate O-acetylesterase
MNMKLKSHYGSSDGVKISYIKILMLILSLNFSIKAVAQNKDSQLAATATGPAQSGAALKLPKVISSNMVLQRDRTVPIWGWATPGKSVSVQFSGQQKKVTTGKDGYWKIELSPLPASEKPSEMQIISDTNKITLTNILVGEVWLASGQSNMEYTMKLYPTYKKPAKGVDSAELELSTHDSQIRLFHVEKVLSMPDVTTNYGWQESGGAALAEFSAPAYYFAKKLQRTLHIPVGIIASSWGGSRIEPWTPLTAYDKLPAFKDSLTLHPGKLNGMLPGRYYQSMIKPLAPFAIRGVIWYQGESNCINNEEMIYADKMQALVNSWREVWQQPKMPFYSVLIAPLFYTLRKDPLPHTPETLPKFWEAQMASVKIPYTGVINVSDLVDHLTEIHPSYKWEVGRRLALLALAKDYGYKKIVYSGPVFRSMRIKGQQAVLYFDHAEGLKTSDNQGANNFEIAGADGVFATGTAKVEGNTIVVHSPAVDKPAMVRFAWKETAQPNLVNGAGFPAFPFRTDGPDWQYGQ